MSYLLKSELLHFEVTGSSFSILMKSESRVTLELRLQKLRYKSIFTEVLSSCG